MGHRGHKQAGAQQRKQPRPERGCETGVTIRDDGLRQAVVAEHQVEEQLGRLVSRHFCRDWSKMDHLAETIHEDENTGAAFGVTWKAEDEVHADRSPRARGDG
ncbi:hypothetical protein PF008_g32547 [Phytophthora fragariae]|uniref:Uncharacterized protein n=1 Tax=Phytophthora fragariae TaxID=53985 RepID=A0A6G0PZI6_9STRA|nr:hypothetical protein PF008_g32547 [Phytophthora fragariae]